MVRRCVHFLHTHEVIHFVQQFWQKCFSSVSSSVGTPCRLMTCSTNRRAIVSADWPEVAKTSSQIIHKYHSILVSCWTYWKLDNIHSDMIKRASHRNWCKRVFYCLSNMLGSTHQACPAPACDVFPHCRPLAVFWQLSMSFCLSKVTSKGPCKRFFRNLLSTSSRWDYGGVLSGSRDKALHPQLHTGTELGWVPIKSFGLVPTWWYSIIIVSSGS